jgi:hypothetical protein
MAERHAFSLLIDSRRYSAVGITALMRQTAVDERSRGLQKFR